MTITEKIETLPEHHEKRELDSLSLNQESLFSSPQIPFVKSDAEKKFVKKLNWTLLPMIWVIVFIQFADKSALSVAAVLGMLEDTKTDNDQYGFLGSIFYIGFIIFQIPNSYLIQRLPTSKYLGSLIICWGISTIGTAFCQTYAHLLACRFLLGIFEAATQPCLILLLNSLYRRSEQSACLGFFCMSNGLGTLFAVVVTFGIVKTLNGAHGIEAWRWIYLIFGILTVCVGIVTFIFLVDSPYSKWLRLTEEEKNIVQDRIQDNAVVKEKTIKIHHYWEALREPRYYLTLIGAFGSSLPNSGLITFSTPFVATLGFNSLSAILLQLPSAAISVFFIFLSVYIHRKTERLSIPIVITGAISMISFLLLIVLPHTAIKLLGYYLSWAFASTYAILITMVANNVSGYSKKVFYNSSMMIAVTLGNFTGPLVMLHHEAPVYQSGMIIFLAGLLATVLSSLISFYLMYRVNKKRLANGITKTDAHLDLTDREDPNFIYKL